MPPLPADPQPLRASGRYLLVHGWVRARHHPSTFDIEIVGGPPNATVTLYLGQRPIRDIMLDDFGRATSMVVLRSAGSTLTFRHGRRLMLEGTLPQPRHTAPSVGPRGLLR